MFKNVPKNTILVKFFSANGSFSWATEQISDLQKKPSNLLLIFFWLKLYFLVQSLICHERFAHSRSFVLSDLSKSLTVANLIWVIWANDRMIDEWMSKFPTLELIRYKKNYHINDHSVLLIVINCCFITHIMFLIIIVISSLTILYSSNTLVKFSN